MKETAKRLKAMTIARSRHGRWRRKITAAGFALDYFEARATGLRGISAAAPGRMPMKDGPVRLLVAARIGETRLIDNMGWGSSPTSSFRGRTDRKASRTESPGSADMFKAAKAGRDSEDQSRHFTARRSSGR